MKEKVKLILAISSPIAMFFAGYMASNQTPNWGWFFGASFVILGFILMEMKDENK